MSNVSCVPKQSGGKGTQDRSPGIDQGESLTVVRVNGKQVEALVDTGSSQTIVRSDLVAQHSTRKEGRVLIRCVHGDEVSYPTVEVYLEVDVIFGHGSGGREAAIPSGIRQRYPRVSSTSGWTGLQYGS